MILPKDKEIKIVDKNEEQENKFITLTRKFFELITSFFIAIVQGIVKAIKKKMR